MTGHFSQGNLILLCGFPSSMVILKDLSINPPLFVRLQARPFRLPPSAFRPKTRSLPVLLEAFEGPAVGLLAVAAVHEIHELLDLDPAIGMARVPRGSPAGPRGSRDRPALPTPAGWCKAWSCWEDGATATPPAPQFPTLGTVHGTALSICLKSAA